MKQLECGLPSARTFCRTHPALCCAACPSRSGCKRQCLNAPDRCGYAGRRGYGSYVHTRGRKEAIHVGKETADRSGESKWP